jgi:hypothetical protein
MSKIIDIINKLKYREYETLIKKNPRIFIINEPFIQTKLEFLGKGGEGIVYKYDNYAIKFYKKSVIFNKDLFALRLANRLSNDKITNNFLTLYGYTQIFKKDVMVVNLIDGTLESWIKFKHTDNEWLIMIFQILYAVLVMQQCMQMYHADMKPKNILFKKINSTVFEYTFNKQSYRIKTDYIFIISDFGHSSSLLFPKSEYNEKNDITVAINNNLDLEHLAAFYKRLVVTIISNTYKLNDLIDMGKGNADFLIYLEQKKQEIEKYMGKYNDKVKSHMLFRSLAYYLLEYDYFDIDNLPNLGNNKIYLPSNAIRKILTSLNNLKGTDSLLAKINEIGKEISDPDLKATEEFSIS